MDTLFLSYLSYLINTLFRSSFTLKSSSVTSSLPTWSSNWTILVCMARHVRLSSFKETKTVGLKFWWEFRLLFWSLGCIWRNAIKTTTKAPKQSCSNYFKYEQWCTSLYCSECLGLGATSYYEEKSKSKNDVQHFKWNRPWISYKPLSLQKWDNRL